MRQTETEVKTRCSQYVSSPAFENAFYEENKRPRLRYIVGACLIPTPLFPAAFALILSGFVKSKQLRKRLQEEKKAALAGAPMLTVGLMINSALLEGRVRRAPGVVIGSFDNRAAAGLLFEVVEKIYAGAQQPSTLESGTAAAVAELFSSTVHCPGRRRKLPPELTEGVEVYAFDLMLRADYMYRGKMEVPLIPCIAGAENDLIKQLPYDVVFPALAREMEQGQALKFRPVDVSSEDPGIQEAISYARRTLAVPEMMKQQGKIASYSVKASFSEGERTEHLWIANVELQNNQFSGIVNNDPTILSTIKCGDIATVALDEVSDWAFMSGGQMYGNFTLRAMLDRLPADEANKLRMLLAPMTDDIKLH